MPLRDKANEFGFLSIETGGGRANLHRMQIICTTSKVGANLHRVKSLKPLFTCPKYIWVQIVQTNTAFSRVPTIYVSSRNMKRVSIVLCFKLNHSAYFYEITKKWVPNDQTGMKRPGYEMTGYNKHMLGLMRIVGFRVKC